MEATKSRTTLFSLPVNRPYHTTYRRRGRCITAPQRGSSLALHRPLSHVGPRSVLGKVLGRFWLGVGGDGEVLSPPVSLSVALAGDGDVEGEGWVMGAAGV